ncbi:MAG: STAS domain-containing protein, partial [Candidatus Eisenbacteria bacterium]
MTQPFSIERSQLTVGTILLRIRGELDARNAQDMVEESKRVLVAGENLVLNLSGVSFIASSGIGALLALVEEFRRGPGTLRLAAISPPVDAVVRLL